MKMDKIRSFVWGMAVSVLGAILLVPFLSLAAMVIVYFFYLKDKRVNLLHYLLGFIFLLLFVAPLTRIFWEFL